MQKRAWGEPNEMPQGIPADRAHRYARRIAVAMYHGNREEAHSIIDEAFDPAAGPLPLAEADRLAMSLAETGLSLRTVNTLERINICTVADLLGRTPEQLLATANFGVASLKECFEMLARLGFSQQKEPRHGRTRTQPPEPAA
jgi:DNA-directed RNA polymerase alpha subunit